MSWSHNIVSFKRQLEDIYNKGNKYKKRLFG